MSDESHPPAVHRSECRDLPLRQVTVFNDRAELKRSLQCSVHPGFNEIHIENITQYVIHDSVRVDGRGGGTIHNVQLREKPSIHEETDSPKVAEVRSRYEEKQNEVNNLKDREAILLKRIEALDEAVMNIASNGLKSPINLQEPLQFTNDTVESLKSFYTFYDESSELVRTELRKVKKSIEKGERELNVLLRELNQAEADSGNHQSSKSIVIDLESNESGLVELEISYQVHGANWHPSYDIRVGTSGKEALKVIYYGNISQSTGEDWTNCALVLSSAQPCLGGQIPELGVLDAIFYRPPPPPSFGMRPMAKTLRCAAANSMFAGPPLESERDFVHDTEMEYSVASVTPSERNALSTEFKISKPAAIPSDGSEHKVAIGIIDVVPQFIHQCVPSKNKSCFLVAFAANSSSLPLLPGEAAVYLNNSFVAKTRMKDVSPGESFTCCLGVDPALHVDYKPVKKYHEQVGLINKSSSTVYEQVIVVKNSHGDSVLLTVKERIPRSTDEKIKVKLIAPVIPISDNALNSGASDTATSAELPKEGIKMNNGILEWTVGIQSGKSVELHVKYAVEHPREETVQFVERH
ncbi:hypothetical protein KIN20_015560 [Parelaphostrongylus tenuis]|uniref:Protein F37C4.5 n=1 Tax=Parelaphostrongylus tenuis TaxID=148309 RepID=A0AAD5QSJ7_PARTN|nr:hypothetical protein KIN20_015560 [Parelaphostrongylus tenuis]